MIGKITFTANFTIFSFLKCMQIRFMIRAELSFEFFDKKETLFTNERFLPALLVEIGLAKSRSEVRKNKPELCVTLDKLDCLWVKWGKHKIFIVVGE